MILVNMNSEAIFKALKLKEHKVYKIRVKTTANNIAHSAILFTGFNTGSYCEVYNNTYDAPISLHDVYSIYAVKELCSLKS